MNISSLYNTEEQLFKSIEIGLKIRDLSISSTEVKQLVSTGGYPYTESVFDLSNGVSVHVYYFTNYTGMDLIGDEGFFSTEDHATINKMLIAIGKRLTES